MIVSARAQKESFYMVFGNLFKEAEIEEGECTLFASKKGIYRDWKGKKFYEGSAKANIPSKSFAIGATTEKFDGISLYEKVKLNNILRATSVGMFINGMQRDVPRIFLDFISEVESMMRLKNSIDDLKLRNEKRKEEWKLRVQEYKLQKKRVREFNKDLEKRYKEALKNAPEEMREFIQEPKLEEVPEKPEEPSYEAVPSCPTPRSKGMDADLAWQVFKHFELLISENFAFLKRRVKPLVFSNNLLFEAIDDNSLLREVEDNELIEIAKEFKYKKHSAAEGIHQDISYIGTMDFICSSDDGFMDMVFCEEVSNQISSPPAARIKPMHAASMLAGGVGNVFKEIIDKKGERLAIKSSLVKEAKTKEIIVNGNRKNISIEQFIAILGVYNQDELELRLLEGAA